MPVKITWKSLVGFLALLGGLLTSTNVAALHLPPNVSTALVAVGGIIIAAERLADAKDFATVGGVDVTAIQKEAAKAVADLEAFKRQAAVDLTNARVSVLADLAKLTNATTSASATATATSAPSLP